MIARGGNVAGAKAQIGTPWGPAASARSSDHSQTAGGVERNFAVEGRNLEIFHGRLRDRHAIERIFVDGWQGMNRRDVVRPQRQGSGGRLFERIVPPGAR